MESPIYSICICNFNMNNTLKSSLETILLQLNEEFEVSIVIKSPKENVKVNYNTISTPKNDKYIKDWDIV